MHSTESDKPNNTFRTFFFGGLLPVIAFTVVEETLGIVWGAVAGMVFAVGEISFEWFRYRRVETITLGAGLMILLLGGVSLLTQDGLWFKLQPAILEAIVAIVLFISVALKKPLLVVLAKKQGAMKNFPDSLHGFVEKKFSGLTFRLAVFFLLHAGLATWAAFEWTTRMWALLKGVGFTVSMIVYMLVEVLWIRKQIGRKLRSGISSS